MIRIQTLKKGIRVTQQITSPSVYLDHWAWRAISESEALASRFSRALKSREGTLVVSWLNIVEFSKVSDETQRRKADALLNQVAMNAFWLNPDFFTVIEHEGTLLPKNAFAPPHSDMEMLDLFFREASKASKSLHLLGSPNFFAAIYNSPRIATKFDRLADEIIPQLEHFRAEFATNPSFRERACASPQPHPASRATRYIARHMINRALKDTTTKLNRNNAIDLCHAVVSASYCDYVLLDGHWAALVNESRAYIDKAGLSLPVAKPFSKRAKGIEDFLTDLECA